MDYINQTWKDKHEKLLRDRNIIIKIYDGAEYGNKIVNQIAKKYNISDTCIYKNLKLWDVKRKGSIKYLLGKILLKDD